MRVEADHTATGTSLYVRIDPEGLVLSNELSDRRSSDHDLE